MNLNHQYARFVPKESPALLIQLRHKKIMINSLLRWCSTGLVSSFIMTIIAGIHFYNQIAATSGWMSYPVLSLFVMLFVWLLFIQGRYSEKRAGYHTVSINEINWNSSYIIAHLRDNQKLSIVFLISASSTFITMTCISIIDHLPAAISL